MTRCLPIFPPHRAEQFNGQFFTDVTMIIRGRGTADTEVLWPSIGEDAVARSS